MQKSVGSALFSNASIIVDRLFNQHRSWCKTCKWSRFCDEGQSLWKFANDMRRKEAARQVEYFSGVFVKLDVIE